MRYTVSMVAGSMKTLVLIRHAKSSWKHPELTDFDRPLNKRGKRDAPDMGRRLLKRGLVPDLVLTSPAKRALKTATIIANILGYPLSELVQDATIYHGDADTLLHRIGNTHDGCNRVFLFGHNPTISELANDLCAGPVGHMPTGAVVQLDFSVNSWQQATPGRGRLVFFDYPKKDQQL